MESMGRPSAEATARHQDGRAADGVAGLYLCKQCGRCTSSPCSGSRCSSMQQRQCMISFPAHAVLSHMQPIHAAALIRRYR